MRSKLAQLALFVVVAGSIAGLTAQYGQSQLGTFKTYIALQPATPGVSQSGHMNVTGAVRAGSFVGSGAGLTSLAWSSLTGVPAGFADGIDNDTTYTAGSGLSLLGNQFRVSGPISIDTTSLYGVHVDHQNNSIGAAGLKVEYSGVSEGSNYAIYGFTDAVHGIGVRADSRATTGFGGGIAANCLSPTGFGIFAENEANTGGGYGIVGESAGPTGTGIQGEARATGGSANTGVSGIARGGAGQGVYGEAANTQNYTNYGVYGIARGAAGKGVYGESFGTSATAYGVLGVSLGSSQSIGVAGSGNKYGVYGAATSGYGIYGYGGAGSDGGGHFLSIADVGRAVFAEVTHASGVTIAVEGVADSSAGRGVQGDSDAVSGTPYGVFGDTDGFGFAVYASGNTGSSGTKSFRIDHPHDPFNKFLLHYCSEGPEPMNQYSGTATTGADGYAWVQLPDYFEEINRDFRYQLTVVDDSDSEDFVQAKVSKRIRGNRFQIRTSHPNTEVCWEVKAVRNDAYVRHYPPQSVMDKPEGERGFFEHPEIHGFGKDLNLAHDRPGSRTSASRNLGRGR